MDFEKLIIGIAQEQYAADRKRLGIEVCPDCDEPLEIIDRDEFGDLLPCPDCQHDRDCMESDALGDRFKGD